MKALRIRRAAVAATVSLAALGAAAGAQARSTPAARGCSAGTRVQTASGPVCGLTAHGQTDYLDVPYAAPPLGARRWQAPQPAARWTTTYAATHRAPQCALPAFPQGGLTKGTSENCLYLEVQEPAHVAPGRRLPVMVELHGGGFLGEYRDDQGANFVHGGPAIYVYVEYRLGVMGFLADAALGAHSGDYGLMDQQAGLRWVKDNIARFGGDPHDVTIFGESAGGASVCDQVASPTARGLFQRGISVSGFYNFDVNTIWWPADCKSRLLTESQAQRLGARFAASVGCPAGGDVAACLRAVPLATLVRKAATYLAPLRGGDIGPIANGTTLPASAAQIFARGRENRVPLIIGVGADEFNGGVYTNSPHHTVVADTAAQYRRLVRTQWGSFAPKVMAMYPIARYPAPSPFLAYRAIMADAFSVCPSLQTEAQLARRIPTYAYLDEDGDSPAEVTGTPQPLGANHSAINRLVHSVPATLDANQLVLQRQVLAQWAGFARNGDVSPDGTPAWSRFGAASDPVMALLPAGESTAVSAQTIEAVHHCGFWDAVNRNAAWAVP